MQGKLEGKINEPMRDLVNTVMNLRVPQKKGGGGTFLDKQPKCYEQIIPRGQRTARFYGVNDTVRVPSPSKA